MDTTKFTHQLTKTLIDIMFYGGILLCIIIPFPFMRPYLIRWVGAAESGIDIHLAVLLISGNAAIFILWQMKQIFKTLMQENPFVIKNVSCLRKSGVASFIIAIAFMVRTGFWFTAGSILIVILCTLLGLFCLTLKDVFKQAIAYKEENDWTV